MSETDIILEQIASELERENLLDILGVGAKRKRDREDAALRMAARREQRREIAGWVRSFKSDGGTRLTSFLEDVATDNRTDFAWGPDVAAALAARLVTATVEIDLASHISNGEHRFRFTLTDEGRERLEQSANVSHPTGETRW